MRIEAFNHYRKKLESFPNAAERVFEQPEIDIRKIRRIHISGVCGTAMASLAGLLTESGYQVSGSDEGCYPPMSDLIENIGITFHEGYAKKNIENKDLIIIGNAIHPDNPEAAHARATGRPQISVAEAVQELLMAERHSLVVAGTHGKTTTTGLLAHIFTSAKRDPLYLVGGVIRGTESSFRFGRGDHFIIEGDEYDTSYFDKAPKFLHYRPTRAILTSVEYDHADIFPSFDDYCSAFRYFVQELAPDGTLFACGDSTAVTAISSSSAAQVVTYGLGKVNDITAVNISVTPEGQSFILVKDQEEIGEFFVPLPGEHNLLNTLAACGMSLAEGITPEELKVALGTFPGMKRRQEVRGEINNILIIDDFAHHPTAVRETIRAISAQYPGRRLVAVFQPRSNTSRRKLFEDDYGESFDDADVIYIASPPFSHSDSEGDRIDADRITKLITERGADAHFGGNTDSLLEALETALTPNDVVLIMSNGAFGGIHERLMEILARNKP